MSFQKTQIEEIADLVSQVMGKESPTKGQQIAKHIASCSTTTTTTTSSTSATSTSSKNTSSGGAAASSSSDSTKKDQSEFRRKKEERKRKFQQQAAAAAASSSSSLRLRKHYDNPTPVGEKKDTSDPIADKYDPPRVEAAWYAWWQKQGYMKPEFTSSTEAGSSSTDSNNQHNKFVMVIPPPNVTGTLHLGHALTNAIEDALARFHRMRGDVTLWVPGCDHAGIATQAVVEKRLAREGLPDRHALGREKFLAEVWKWKNEKGGTIYEQLKRLGASVDWDRETFTMSEGSNKAVIEAFVRLYDTGKIYRANRLVNWCVALNTAISDIEVDPFPVKGRTRVKVPGYERPVLIGVMDHFKYAIHNGNDDAEAEIAAAAAPDAKEGEHYLVIATTRLETMLGDVAVAVHPDDERYKHLHGKSVRHPIDGRIIPIVTDDELVIIGLGTGVVKITPAHDQKDFQCALRHDLPIVNILNPDGTMNKNVHELYQGKRRYAVREDVRKHLEQLGMFVERKDHEMVVGRCSRSKDIIEPFMLPQWYVDCKEMAARSCEAVRSGDLRIFPESARAEWFRWLEDPHDWCVSRQLWWGHRIPAYLFWHKSTETRPSFEKQSSYVVARSEEEARLKAKKLIAARLPTDAPAVTDEDVMLEQDPDVLDTWFSSGLFPFSVFGWPEQTDDFQKYFPTSLLETGSDILFFWVARMVMMSLTLLDKLPFRDVYLHPMVRDAHGRKMSKSLGNVLDPLDVIEGITLKELQAGLRANQNIDPSELKKALAGQRKDYPKGISECGTDALRFALCSYTSSQSTDINLSVDKVVAYRNWCNKVWQATRFILSTLPDDFEPAPYAPDHPDSQLMTLLEYSKGNHLNGSVNNVIAAQLNATIAQSIDAFLHYNLGNACRALYDFFLKQFCSTYLEIVKPIVREKTNQDEVNLCCELLYTSLETTLRLLHPFMPFLTEDLWQRIPRRKQFADIASITIAPYPKPFAPASFASNEIEEMNQLSEMTTGVNAIRAQYNLTSQKPEVYLRPATDDLIDTLASFSKRYQHVLMTLSKISKITTLSSSTEQLPKGCALYLQKGLAEVYVHLAGMVDFKKESARLGKKVAQVQKKLDSLVKRTTMANYETKVPQHVRDRNTQQIEGAKFELQKLSEQIEGLKAFE